MGARLGGWVGVVCEAANCVSVCEGGRCVSRPSVQPCMCHVLPSSTVHFHPPSSLPCRPGCKLKTCRSPTTVIRPEEENPVRADLMVMILKTTCNIA